MSSWFLEGFVDDGTAWRTQLDPLPFRVGRMKGCQLELASASVSGRHAEFVSRDGGLALRDLESTNGTFVNFDRLQGTRELKPGDIIHFADREFRLIEQEVSGQFHTTLTMDMERVRLLRDAVKQRRQLEMLVRDEQVTAEFQPVFEMASGKRCGFELLGRGLRRDLPREPIPLCVAAEALGLESDLSEAFRRQGMTLLEALPPERWLFLNTHPAELQDPDRLVRALRKNLHQCRDRTLVVEVHEMAVTDLEAFGALRDRLSELGVEIAFDDFGRGRQRFRELVEFAPSFVKFDRFLIEGLDVATEPRRDLVRRLVDMVRSMEVATVAEGVETEGEAEICRDCGFEYAQGFYYGRPEVP